MGDSIKEYKLDEQARIQAAMCIDKILEYIKESEPLTTPRPHVVLEFSDDNTAAVLYDRFVGILEWNENSEHPAYVAMGWCPDGELQAGNMEIVDIRVLGEEYLPTFQEVINNFVRVMSKSDATCISVEGPITVPMMIEKINEIWGVVQETQNEIIH